MEIASPAAATRLTMVTSHNESSDIDDIILAMTDVTAIALPISINF